MLIDTEKEVDIKEGTTYVESEMNVNKDADSYTKTVCLVEEGGSFQESIQQFLWTCLHVQGLKLVISRCPMQMVLITGDLKTLG